LYVEDDTALRGVVTALLADIAHVTPAGTLAAARARLAHDRYDLVVLDVTLPDGDGLELLPLLSAYTSPTPALICAGAEVTRETTDAVVAALVKARTSEQALRETMIHVLAQRGAGGAGGWQPGGRLTHPAPSAAQCIVGHPQRRRMARVVQRYRASDRPNRDVFGADRSVGALDNRAHTVAQVWRFVVRHGDSPLAQRHDAVYNDNG
jgi:CheY-like chemotaxis protein